MSIHDDALQTRRGASVGTAAPVARRINIAVNAAMLAAIDRIIEREHVTMTEAVRRLIGLGDFVYETTRIQGSTLIVRDRGGGEREVVVL